MSLKQTSSQPRKQRKARFEARLHERQKMVCVHVGKELRGRLNTKRRSLPVRKGDKVKVMRGKNKGKTGKVSRVDLNSLKVFVEGLVARKARGTEELAPIDASNLLLIEADFGDKQRKAILERSAKA